ncbi:MAG TPA: hypothetical protein VNN79_15335, partial [Actinomycetota bacterium]|nr:hypothetical protein [Actinomycetota bacterium]
VSVVVLSTATGASAGSPRDSVVGGGQHLAFGTGPGVVAVGISAHSGPSGEDPKGTLTFTNAGEGTQSLHANVTCLIVVGNEAFATGVFTHPAEIEGQTVVLDAVDNGNPSSDDPDLIRFSFEGAIVPVAGQPDCFLPVLPPVPVTKGNLSVHDASA